nr:synaptobrevin, longin-like domain protein [Tanacetum cinerariifolium]
MLYLLRVDMVLNSPCPYWVSKNWLVQKQMALGKNTLNPLMADNLLKNVWYSTHHITLMKSWLVQKQTALGKDSSNPLTVDSLLKTIWFSIHHHLTNEVLAILGQTETGKEISNPFMAVNAVRKKVVLSEAVIQEVLRLDDAEGVDCLPNEEIFTGLARIGYEKPSTKLTFYKAFFSSQWKFLIHTIQQSMIAKRTSWNEFSSAMASAVICLSTGRKFNFSKYIFDSLVRNVDSSSKCYMYPRIGKGFSRVETPLFEGMLVVRENVEANIGEEQVLDDTVVAAAQEVVTTAASEDVLAVVLEDVHNESIPSPAPPTPPPKPSQDIPSTS